MTVTADQAQMLATLGLSMRPYAAPRFDGQGIRAQIKRVDRMALHEVALVVIAVCVDPSLTTPANIGDTHSRHWAGVHVIGAEPAFRDVAPVGSRCTVCGDQELRCQSRWALTGNPVRDEKQGRHEFTHPHERTVDIAPVVTELKGLAVREEVEA